MRKKASFILLGVVVLSLVAVIAINLTRTVQAGNTVIANYTIRLADGTVYYSSLGRGPLRETLGEGKLIRGFEEALLGMRLGQSRTVTIPPEEAYGQYDPGLVGTVGRDRLPEDVEPVVGKQLWTELRDGRPTLATITEFTEQTVTLDANHPLAGLDLTFQIQLLGVDDQGPLGRLTNLTVLSWSLLALAALFLGLAIFFLVRRGGLKWLRARGLGATFSWRRRLRQMRFRRVDWFLISFVSLGALLLGLGLISALVEGKARPGDTVSIYYTLALDDGTVYNATAVGEPLQLTLGDGALIPGVEEALVGMRVGESKTVTIPPEKAYGPHRPELVFEYDRSELPEGSQPMVGQQVETTLEDGTAISMVITELDETTVTMDANHRLAGQDLIFDIELVDIGEDIALSNRPSPAGFTWFALLLGLPALGAILLFMRGRLRVRARSATEQTIP